METEARKRKYDRHPRTKPSPVQVGQQVLVRDRTVLGGNKIYDRWGTRVHKGIEQLDNDTYVIEPADGHSRTRVVNRAELQVCSPAVLQKTPGKAGRPCVPRGMQ